MQNHFMNEILHQMSDMQNFFVPSDELSALLAQYAPDNQELNEKDLDLVFAAQGDYQKFIKMIRDHKQK